MLRDAMLALDHPLDFFIFTTARLRKEHYTVQSTTHKVNQFCAVSLSSCEQSQHRGNIQAPPLSNNATS